MTSQWWCERSLVTGFQLSSPDAIYNQDGKKRGEDSVPREVTRLRARATRTSRISVHDGAASDIGLARYRG
jgi:hypothetical protein